MVCHCDLLMVIAKLSLTRNYFLRRVKGSLTLSVVLCLILGKKVFLPAWWPDRISTSNMFIKNPWHNSLVPLHRLDLGSMFHNNIKGAPFLTFKICRGKPPRAMECKYLCWYKLCVSPSTLLNDNKFYSSPRKWPIIMSLIFWTSLFFGISMALCTI